MKVKINSSEKFNLKLNSKKFKYTLTLTMYRNNRGPNQYGKNQKGTRQVERPGLTEDEIEEIREAFNLFDTEGSG